MYAEILSSLSASVYPCSCSRKQLQTARAGKFGYIYPGHCRKAPIEPAKESFSYRLHTGNSGNLSFTDQIQGIYCQNIEKDVGDFVLKRADGLFAYQLAVIADDENQGVTHVVRGNDLLDNTPRQIYLQKKLGYSTPSYAHFPVATFASGKKLSKQNKAPVVSIENPLIQIHNALIFLGQNPPPITDFTFLEDLWKWSVNNWRLTSIPRQQTITLTGFDTHD